MLHAPFAARAIVTAQGPVAWPDGTVATRFRFHYALYQEVLYGRLPLGHRGQLHRLVAVREEVGFGERVSEVAAELAHYYHSANDSKKAIHYFQLAGERAGRCRTLWRPRVTLRGSYCPWSSPCLVCATC